MYAVIAMCLELKAMGYTDDRIIPAVEKSMESRWNAFVRIIKLIDLFPFSFPVVRIWNKSDHADRIKDGSITYDLMYSGLTRHVNFVRHSDLSDGDACFDEIFRK